MWSDGIAAEVPVAFAAVPFIVPVGPTVAVPFAPVLVALAKLFGNGVAVAFAADEEMLARKVVVAMIVWFEMVMV